MWNTADPTPDSPPRRHRPRWQPLPALALVLVCSALPVAAQERALCDGLKAITAESQQSYRALRGNFDSAMDAYFGRLLPAPFTLCHTHADDGRAEYQCQQRLPDDEAAARRAFDVVVLGVQRCFGSDVRAMRTSMPDHRAQFRNTVGGESITVSFRRHVPKYADMPPRYVLRMEVSILDMNR